MAAVSAIASSGLRAAQLRMDTSAHNVANLNTPGFKRQTVESEAVANQGGVAAGAGRAAQDGVSVEGEAVEQIAATYAFTASLQVLRTGDRMMGALLDERA
ncbi:MULTISPECIES: flagellar basal body protein [unclassified Acidovorax]|uniref:flagellar basal body protein n=1 Tax=unclassified Acidovorax TaxID=2684926 RepID=UPI0028830DB5|nr:MULTISPECIES: flagellar basal body protein [unclassified Acidovorax]